MTDKWLIEEILTKECERYELEKSGFVTDRHRAVEELLAAEGGVEAVKCSLNEFVEWKGCLLSKWYAKKGFAKFFLS